MDQPQSNPDLREREIFLEALDQASPEARVAFLDGACRGDATLRRGVEAMLTDHFSSDSFMAAPAAGEAPLGSSEHAITERPGDRIGRYKLLEKIGEGGCGVVYMAEQEEPVRRKVALKVIKTGMDTRHVIARFEAERQALAMMDHPNIAKFYDAGVTEHSLTRASGTLSPIGREGGSEGAGRPYFVMELVRGIKITDYCNQNNLSTGARLDLFIQVCHAVQHAHQKGIIHRDLKPSNILVTENDGVPVPKVIDFGIVKATEQKLTDKTLFTQFAQFIGTPAYMSPEQAAMTSLDIDTRSDIYSLGVLLYELLTGTTPFDAQELLKAGFDEMRRIIRETEPVRPSTRLTQSALTGPHSSLATRPSPVATDLDWIVMKCLEKDRNRRYETANGLGADIRRHLSNEPVVARPPSRLYEFQKTVRRHKVGFAGTVAVLLALVGGVGVSSWQAVKAGRAERTAKEQAAIAREQSRIASEQSENATAVKAFLTKTLMGINPCCDTPDPDAISYEATRALVDRVARRLEGQFTDQPLVEADIRLALAAAFGAARDIPAMAIHAEKAVELRQRVLGRAHSDTLEAICDLAFAKYRLGQREQAHELLAEATMLARGSPGGVSLGGGRAIGTRGILLTFDGRAEEALPYLEETLAVLTRLEWPKDKGISKANALKQWMGGRILTVQRTGRLQEAEKLWRDLIQESGRDLGADHPVTMNFQFDLARLLLERKNWHGALPLIQRVVAFRQQTVGENHYITLDARYSLGAAFAAKGDIEAAAGTYAEVYPQFAKYFNLDSARGVSKDMADFFVRQRRYRDARGVFDGFRSWFDANPPQNTADFEWFLRATAATKDWPAAAEVCRKHFDAFPDSLWLWLNKAWIFRFAGDDESYQRVVAQVLALSSSVLATNDQHVPIEIAALGSFPFSAQQVKQLNSMVDALEVALSGRPADLQTWGYRAIGQLQLRLERFDRSLAALEKSAKQQTSPDPYNLFIKAICLHRLARSDEARAAFDQAETIMKAGSLNQPEGFLRTWEIYQQLLMRREAQAALAGTQPNANQRATP